MTALPAVVLTYGWCRVSYVILQSLARHGVDVHVGDHSRVGMCRFSRRARSRFVYRNPYRDPEGFTTDVAAALTRTGATVLIPGHEDNLPLARHRHLLPGNVHLPVGDPALIARVSNKWELAQLAPQFGVEVPLSFKPERPEDLAHALSSLSYPAIVKPQVGNSAKGVYVVATPEEARARFEELVRTYSLPAARWPMLQAFAPGTGYGVCLLYNRGELRASFCEKYLRCKEGTFGTSVFRESVHAPALVERAIALMSALKWHGVVHLDFLHEPSTRATALIEVNARFWGALDLAVRSGVDFPWLLYRMAVDGDVTPVTEYRLGVRSRWIVGELLHVFNRARRDGLVDAARALRQVLREPADGFDDFRSDDPVPLAAEAFYYASRFAVTRSVNPVDEGMIA